MFDRSFWIRLFILGAAVLFFGRNLAAQAPMVSFDSLYKTRPADTRRTTTAPKPRAAGRSDTIQVVAVKTAATAPASAPARVDTVRVVTQKTDTVFVAAKPAPPAAKAPAAVTFSAPQVSGLLQVQVTGGDNALRSTYRIRRGEIKVVSDMGRRAQAVMMIDIAKSLSVSTSGTATTVTQSSRVLQDAYLVIPAFGTTFEAGQQRLPLSWEGSFSSSGLETVDRALFESDRARGGSLGDVRDLGLAARGKWRVLDYRAGLFNGSGESMNETDKNVGKAFAGQLGVRPAFVKGFRFGVSGATSGKAAGDKPTRDRLGADLQYVRGRLYVQSEAMTGRDAAIVRQGLYAYSIWKFTQTLKAIARFDAWDPDIKNEVAAANVTERDYMAGVTWLPAATRLKVQLNVVRKTYTRDVVPAVTQLLTQVQASW